MARRGQKAATPLIDRAWTKAKGSIPQAFGRGAQAGQFRAAEARTSMKHGIARNALAGQLAKAHSNATSKGGDEQVSGKRVRAKAYIAGYKAQTGLAGGGGSARGRQRRDARGRFA